MTLGGVCLHTGNQAPTVSLPAHGEPLSLRIRTQHYYQKLTTRNWNLSGFFQALIDTRSPQP